MLEKKLVTDIELVGRYAKDKVEENWRFRTFVKHRLEMEDADLDALVQETTDAVWKQIDCTQCANCCRKLQVLVDDEDILRLANRLGRTKEEFRRQYVRKNQFGESHIKSLPCVFLKDNRCSVYEDRPKACRDFPYLYEAGFRSRMLIMIDNTAHCPIVYNTYERLKRQLMFRRLKQRKNRLQND